MVCGSKCGCSAFCRRLFCRARPSETNANEEAIPVTSTQLAEARDIKFTQNLTEPLSIGSHIVCTGTPSDDLPWFAVNIGCGDLETSRGDIAVHFNVRLPQCYVVRNTRRHDKWGSEETTAYRLFPFKINRPFSIEILVDEKETLWAVDGEHYCSYAHRNPSALNANWVQVTGVRDAALKIQKTDVYPTLAPAPIDVPIRSSLSEPAKDEPTWRPNIIATLTNGIQEGHQLVIIGRLRPLLHSFTIDLMDCGREWPRANILLHANVRAHVESQLARQLVVLNAWLGAWGPERRQRTARLVPGTKATFRIVRNPAEWSVFADDVLIGELEYRAAANGVRAMRIRGDLYPDQIYVCPATDSPQEEIKASF
ncbi:galectin-4-like isoform X2 [Maniola jurtina]|uniref:galectin-4-like isoform X2 n=1 Tax=Maniola jurtina TaxID=191418 RepID=UPI001E68FD2F|nr:galectin-4-like isoform X2 [Maniola jurtina]XP_045768182.1 galectin-4-like isoform X2 [Maniola jurtina]XP_045768183.1 galectin-4-like isoform X2 [Maniola jurtina]